MSQATRHRLPALTVPVHSSTSVHLSPPLLLRPTTSSSTTRLSLLPARRPIPRRRGARGAATGGGGRTESPYEVLGVSPSAAPGDIKRAYRRLALKYHPDVNKEANAQEKFMRIKHAYNTLMNSESRFKYANSNSDFSRTSEKSKSSAKEEEFYGFAEFFKDLQAEFENWEAGLNSQQQPKSLWEELAEIGEEFVEFLEKELNINDSSREEGGGSDPYTQFGERTNNAQGEKTATSSIEDSIAEIEATLAKLKKELGLN